MKEMRLRKLTRIKCARKGWGSARGTAVNDLSGNRGQIKSAPCLPPPGRLTPMPSLSPPRCDRRCCLRGYFCTGVQQILCAVGPRRGSVSLHSAKLTSRAQGEPLQLAVALGALFCLEQP